MWHYCTKVSNLKDQTRYLNSIELRKTRHDTLGKKRGLSGCYCSVKKKDQSRYYCNNSMKQRKATPNTTTVWSKERPHPILQQYRAKKDQTRYFSSIEQRKTRHDTSAVSSKERPDTILQQYRAKKDQTRYFSSIEQNKNKTQY
ncbi:hypothetical protein ElyMa_006101600 [Elysia marginata]|uniref:Uncharacterized protein n=1 Tax=Elysia marginata TaxID=1093978 RepID=A0AAV4GT02_9GAST|nr:hypothetical protein ElyMa_006101600 [Elysia marginata]